MNRAFCHKGATSALLALLVLLLTIPASNTNAQSDTNRDTTLSIERYLSVITNSDGVRLVSESDSATLTEFPTGTILWATGRSAESQYLYVHVDKQPNSQSGWIMTDSVVAFGINLIPVREIPDATISTLTALTSATEASPAPSSQTAAGDSTVAVDSQESVDAQSTDSAERIYVVANNLNVRSGPGTEHGVVAQVTRGDELTIVERSADAPWIKVSLPSADQSGWVSAQFVGADPRSSAASGEGSGTALLPVPITTGLRGMLAFQQSIGGQIYTYDLGSGALQAITTGAEPALSPDRSTVVFTRSDGLYLIDADGSNERLIFSGRENLGSPKWSPDGETILFTRGDEWQACVKGGFREVCTESSEVGEGKYKKIMYAIAAVDVDGGNYRDVVSTKPARAPDWTEAGIVYQSTDGLQRTKVDRDAVNSLIDYDYLDPYYFDPDWRPGGNQIVFQSKEGSHWQIFTINSDGSARYALTAPQTALVDQLPSSVAPAFSPDGAQIVFLSNRTSSGEAGAWRLWIMDANGSNQRVLPINVGIDYTYGVEQVVSWQ